MKSPHFRNALRWTLRLIPVGIALGCGSVIAAASQSQDPNLLVEQGRQLFSKAFKVEEGFGYRLGSPETVLVDRQLGPDAKSCLECHAQGGAGAQGDQRQAEYEAYKKRCNEQTPPGLDKCDEARFKLRRNKDCRNMRQAWDDRWQPGRHKDDIENLDRGIKKLEDFIAKNCNGNKR